MPPRLNPGDRVVELASLVVSSAVAPGAVVAAFSVWRARQNWALSAGAFFAGGILGVGVGKVVGRILYRTTDGQSSVVKVGLESFLRATIPAGVAGAIATAIIVALIARFIFNSGAEPASQFAITISLGMTIGIVLAALASLL